MDMSGMSGMSMDDSGGFIVVNSALARDFWYLIAGVLGFSFLIRIIDYIEIEIRLRIARTRSIQHPSKPRNFVRQIYATTTAICREISAPELHFKNRWLSWLSPPSMGRCLVLATYWAVIIYMLRWESVVYDAYYWERIGFRAAWISVTQIPFVYLLAMKSSIIGYLSGSSHERLNWLHRWVSRTLLITVTIHGGHFWTEWVLAGNIGIESFVTFELNMMPMVKYGIGAWFILLWTFLSSLAPIRRWSYEVFVLQHLAAAAVFLWVLWVHVPSYAAYNIWFAIATITFDKIFLFCWSAWENVRIRPIKATPEIKPKIIGHHAELRRLNDETSEVIVKDVMFKWRPGQHVYLRLPTIGPFESHPFTIANACTRTSTDKASEVQLVIQAQSGFTRRLHRKAQSVPEGSKLGLTAIVTGPYGCPPNWNAFETLILISASTGASFTLPILQSILLEREYSCVSRIDFLMLVRRRCGVRVYLARLKEAVSKAEEVGIALNVRIAITGEDGPDLAEFNFVENFRSAPPGGCQCGVDNNSITSTNSSATGSIRKGDNGSNKVVVNKEKEVRSCCCGVGRDSITYACGRPDVADFIRQPIEDSGGETSVAVCGGNSLVAIVRNAVASLSDERAVHKGTGAQGIHLHAEHYCF